MPAAASFCNFWLVNFHSLRQCFVSQLSSRVQSQTKMASVRNPPTLHILTFTIFTQLENNAPFLSLKILHNHCLEFLLERMLYPGEDGNNGYEKLGGSGG